jgi:AcrR family transcriptional regulator
MKDKILQTASQLFLNLGVKSVTMDDIAERMAISKKTIYGFYKSKTQLVKATSSFLFEQIKQRIDGICSEESEISPIESLFEINDFMNMMLKEDHAPEFQLQKYYPKIFESLKKKKFDLITEGITENLVRGITQGLYRNDIDIPTIARLYYANSIAIKNPDIFPLDTYRISELMHIYLIYHIRAIATPKGLTELETIIKNEQ